MLINETTVPKPGLPDGRCTTQEELTDEKMNAHFLWSAGKEAYDLIQGTSQLPS